MNKKSNVVFVSLILFTIFYWIAALHKNFHVDEFYSWVYAERTTFKEILFLNDTGIGHPPLYHLIQKGVQQLFPYIPAISVRVANYFVGMASIVVLILLLSQTGFHPFFFYGLSMSAGVLNTFIFARMWGLTFFFAALLIYMGEKYARTRNSRYLLYFYGAALFGFLSDYSFILLLPYMFWITFLINRRLKLWLSFFFGALLLGRIVIAFFEVQANGITLIDFIHSQFIGFENLIYQSGITLFDFWFKEPFLVAIILILIFFSAFLIGKIKKKIPIPFLEKIVFYILFLLATEIILRLNLLKTIYVLPFFILIGVSILFEVWKKKSQILISSNSRLLLSLACGLFLLSWINEYFWRHIIDARFLTVFLPLFFLLLTRILNKKLLYVMSSIFAVSGVMYAFSGGVSDNYPPPRITTKLPVVYQDAYAYSTQYFYITGLDTPFIADFTPFYLDCRVCKMGQNIIPFQTFDTVTIVWRSNSDPTENLPSDFELLGREERGLLALDRLQFRYFNPIHSRRYAIFTFSKKRL